MKKLLGVGVVCGALLCAQGAQALTITNTSAEVKGNVETEWKVEEGEKSAEGEKGGTEDINIGVGEMQESQHNESDMEFVGRGVSASAVEVRGWDQEKKQEFLSTVKTWAEVHSDQDLENFAQGVLLRDDQVEKAAANENKAELKYRMPAKFLGVLDMSLSAHAEVNAEGRVKVRYPWYGFLFSKGIAAEDLKAEIAARLPEVGDEVLVGFENRARALTALGNALKAKYEANIE